MKDMKNTTVTLAKLSNGKYAIVSGKSVLRTFNNRDKAWNELMTNLDFYEYWAESASVSIENTDAIIINA